MSGRQQRIKLVNPETINAKIAIDRQIDRQIEIKFDGFLKCFRTHNCKMKDPKAIGKYIMLGLNKIKAPEMYRKGHRNALIIEPNTPNS